MNGPIVANREGWSSKQAHFGLLEARLATAAGGEPHAAPGASGHLRTWGVLMPVLACALLGCGWREATPMPTARSMLGTAMVNGLVYAIGGWGQDPYALTTVEEYNPAVGTWRARSPLQLDRYRFSIAVVGGEIYVLGGDYTLSFDVCLNSVQTYDPVADLWRDKAPMPTGRCSFGAVALQGTISVVGGYCWKSTDFLEPVPCTLDEYDSASDTWTVGAPMPDRLQGDVAAVALGQKIYAIRRWCDPVCTLDELDPVTKTWTPRAPLPTPREGFAFVAWKGKIYAIGGYDSSSRSPLGTMEAYDPASDTWAPRAPMPTARYNLAAAATGQSIFAIGGVGTGNTGNTVEEYSGL